MIKKYQQGGQTNDAIMQFVQGIALTLQADPLQIIQAAQQNPDALKAAVQVYQETLDMQLAAQTFALAMLQQVQAAKHGAKLQYIKSLKNQCADDEEVVYFKKGGHLTCGCKKKENGGQVKKAGLGCSVVEKFKGLRPNKYQYGGNFIEKSDNTRVLLIPNKGTGVYEEIPYGYEDLIPLYGTYREAKRLDQNDKNASKLGLGVSLAGDLVGAGMVGPVIKAASKYNKISKALKASKFFRPTNTGTQWVKVGTRGTKPVVLVKNVPEVDYSGVVLAPLTLTLRVPGFAASH